MKKFLSKLYSVFLAICSAAKTIREGLSAIKFAVVYTLPFLLEGAKFVFQYATNHPITFKWDWGYLLPLEAVWIASLYLLDYWPHKVAQSKVIKWADELVLSLEIDRFRTDKEDDIDKLKDAGNHIFYGRGTRAYLYDARAYIAMLQNDDVNARKFRSYARIESKKVAKEDLTRFKGLERYDQPHK